jgi:hypothetical protein
VPVDRRLVTGIVVLLAVIGALSVVSFVLSTVRWLVVLAVLVAVGVLVAKLLRGPPPDPEGRW